MSVTSELNDYNDVQFLAHRVSGVSRETCQKNLFLSLILQGLQELKGNAP